MTVGEITRALEAFAPLDIQESWDNSGLLIGSPQDPVHGVLVGFDCTPELIEEAVEKGCDMVVTHHPLIFKGIRRINSGDPVGAAVMKAVQKGVAVYAAHTTADKVIGGVSGAMARRLDLKDVEFLEPGPEGF
ncbi:MAG: Nif3-like dinuclear metal center hexameric protein, partial [Bacteroidales bacterium]|nr:Nif3-like dinuclear metal center hexameric protein [Bacteroidales bacterium]